MTKRIRTKRKLRSFRVGEGLPNLTLLSKELQDMMDVLLGREEPPLDGDLALMETADAYFARACEIEMQIQRKAREGDLPKVYQSFRTTELRNFKETAKRAADLGSRRLTAALLEMKRQESGRDSRG